jgi:site-specific DNA-methyltransferase (cytosine-N4-specific)
MSLKEKEDFWDFNQTEFSSPLHKLHSYPATFPPRLAQEIIKKYSKKNDLILDIFSGSGTSLLESNLLSRNCIGQDLNPLANLISKVKTSKLRISKLNEIKLNLIQKISIVDANEKVNKDHFWFESETLSTLKEIKSQINSIHNKKYKDFFLISLSQIIRRVSKLNHHGFKMHRNKNKRTNFKSFEIVHDFFFRQVDKNIRAFEKEKNLTGSDVKIFTHDSRLFNQKIKKKSVDLILTSPPYGDSKSTVAYGEFVKLSSEILQIKKNKTDLDHILLGGSKKQNNQVFENSNTLTESLSKLTCQLYKEPKNYNLKSMINKLCNFYDDLNLSLSHCSQYIKNKKYLCIVIARRKVKGVVFKNDEIIEDFLKPSGFILVERHSRKILNKRMPHKVNASNIPGINSPTMLNEEILIFRKN